MIEEVEMGSRIEPLLYYVLRFVFICISFVVIFFLLGVLAIIMIFICYKITDKISGGANTYSEGRMRRNSLIMNTMRNIPYSQFML